MATVSRGLPAWAALASALCLPLAQADEPLPAKPSSPWGFNLSTYLWLAGVTGDFSVGPRSRSVDANFIDIVDKSSRVPLGFMGRAEAHYERFGFYLDGNYINLELKPVLQAGNGLNTELGILDYGLMYRIFGPTAAEMGQWRDKKSPNRLDVYAGARTLWLNNSASVSLGPLGLVEPGFSKGKSFTSPIIGGRLIIDFTPHWFAMADANFGGFGAQNVDFTGSAMGVAGYKTSLFGVPATVEAGYKALRYNVGQGGLVSANATLNGPFIGLTGYW